jgi:hypothetical protein
MTGLYLVAAALALASALRTALRLRRERSPMAAVNALCMLASGAALILTATTPSLLAARPSHPVLTWAAAVLGLVAAWAFLSMLASVTGEEGRPATRFAVPAAGAVLAVLTEAALGAARHGAPRDELPAEISGLILLACYCPALGKIAALAWRCSRRIPVRHIEVGMRAVAVAAAAELALILARSAEIITVGCGAPAWGAGSTAVEAAQGIAVIQVIVGATVPAWFPAAASASRHCRMWAAWCRLRPLWALLLEAAPDVELPARPGTRLSPRFRLHRRVIEIRDAELALRPFWDSDVAREAARAARSAGLSPDQHDAVIEAVMILTALGARRAGAEASADPHAGRSLTEPRNDLESETARLLLVSRAVRHSPIVRRAGSRPAADRRPA